MVGLAFGIKMFHHLFLPCSHSSVLWRDAVGKTLVEDPKQEPLPFCDGRYFIAEQWMLSVPGAGPRFIEPCAASNSPLVMNDNFIFGSLGMSALGVFGCICCVLLRQHI